MNLPVPSTRVLEFNFSEPVLDDAQGIVVPARLKAFERGKPAATTEALAKVERGLGT